MIWSGAKAPPFFPLTRVTLTCSGGTSSRAFTTVYHPNKCEGLKKSAPCRRLARKRGGTRQGEISLFLCSRPGCNLNAIRTEKVSLSAALPGTFHVISQIFRKLQRGRLSPASNAYPN